MEREIVGAELESLALVDGNAAMALAERHLLGLDGVTNRKAAFEAVQRAAKLGNVDGRRSWVYMTAAGLGCRANPAKARLMLKELGSEDRFAAVQHAFLQHVTCDKTLDTIEPEVLSADPYVAFYRGLFSAAECQYLMVLGQPWLQTAMVTGVDGTSRLDEVRDAKCCSIVNLAEDLVVQTINRTIARATGTEPGWGEPLNILQYGPGQQYKPHLDGMSADNVTKRNYTALIWLNDDFDGGETNFPDIDLKVRGAVGDMLVFKNVRDDGELDHRMIHAGLPVTRGVKWMASRWIRGEDYLRG